MTSRTRLFYWSLFGLMLVLFAVRNLPFYLDDYDEAKQTFVALEIVQDGNWLFQHTPDGGAASKPPLMGWISALLYLICGSWEFAWRFPSFLAALAIIWILKKEGDALGDGVGEKMAWGWLAILIFGLNSFTTRLATMVRTDMLLTLFIFLAGILIYRKVRSEESWKRSEKWGIGFVIFCSILLKGPILYAFLLPGLVAYSVYCRKNKIPNHAWSGWASWVVPLLLFLVWTGYGAMTNRDFYEQVVMKEFLGRFTVGEKAVHKSRPVYEYLGPLLLKCAPWSLCLLAFAFWKTARRKLFADRGLLWLFFWAMGALVLMSLIPSKRADRIFPIIPPFALLLTGLFAAVRDDWKWKKPLSGYITILAVLALLFSGGYTVYDVRQGYKKDHACLVRFGEEVRKQATENGWSFRLVKEKDEGMFSYLRQTRLLKWGDAETAWKNGELDALVFTEAEFEKRKTELGAYRIALVSGKGERQHSRYYLIVRANL